MTEEDKAIKDLFEVGAHYGYTKSRRHPSLKSYIFGVKSNVEIFDLGKTSKALEGAKEFVRKLGEERKTLLIVGGKHEARTAVKEAAQELKMPYVAGRWIGGTLTNLSEVRKRVNKLLDLREKREKGELEKYTKKERLLIDRDIERLENNFSGLISMEKKPDAMFVVDPGREEIAVKEAELENVPVVALAGSDCDISGIEHPIPANDSNVKSIEYFVKEIKEAYREGRKKAPAEKEDTKKEDKNKKKE